MSKNIDDELRSLAEIYGEIGNKLIDVDQRLCLSKESDFFDFGWDFQEKVYFLPGGKTISLNGDDILDNSIDQLESMILSGVDMQNTEFFQKQSNEFYPIETKLQDYETWLKYRELCGAMAWKDVRLEAIANIRVNQLETNLPENKTMVQVDTLSDGVLVTSTQLRDAPHYKQVIGRIAGDVHKGIVTIDILYALRKWQNFNNGRPDKEFVSHHNPSFAGRFTSAFVNDVTVITQDQMHALVTDQKGLAENIIKEMLKMKEYGSYNELVNSPEAHVEFLRTVSQDIDQPNGTGCLYERMAASIKVNKAPFSQAKHLTALESNSDGWDLDETADSVKVEIVQLSAKVKEVDSGYDIPHFTSGFEWMIRDMRERGVKVEGGLNFEKEKEVVRGVDYESPRP